MKNMFKGLLCFLLAITVPFTSSPFFAQGASAATGISAIPSAVICGPNIKLFSDNAGGYLLASTDKNKYMISRLPAGGGSPVIVTGDTSTGATKTFFVQSNGILYILYSVNTFIKETNTFAYQTTLISYNPADNTIKSTKIAPLQILSDVSATVDKEGKLYALSADRSKIMIYSSSGASLCSMTSSRGQYSAVCCSPDGSTVYVGYTISTIQGMGVFNAADYLNYTGKELPLQGSIAPQFPLRFLNSQNFIDADGRCFLKDQNGLFEPATQVYSSSLPVCACLTSDNRMLYNRGNGIIFAADPQSYNVLGQYSLTGTLVDMASSGSSACAIVNTGSGYGAISLNRDSFSPVQFKEIVPPQALCSAETLKEIWQQMNPAPGADISAFVDVLKKNGGTNASNYTVWPAVGDFPLEMLPGDHKWSITLNSSALAAGDCGAPKVEIERNSTGEKVVRTLQNGLALSEDGRTLSFDAPENCQDGDAFTVRVYNVRTLSGEPAVLSYSLKLFSLLSTEPDKPGELTSNTLKIDRAAREISGIPIGTTVAEARKALGSPDKEIRTLRPDGSVVSSGNAGTGMRMQLIQNGTVTDELSLVVFGDLTGEGNVNSLDISRLMNYLLNQDSLSGPALEAADLNHDGMVDTLDLVRMKKFTFGMSDIIQTK